MDSRSRPVKRVPSLAALARPWWSIGACSGCLRNDSGRRAARLRVSHPDSALEKGGGEQPGPSVLVVNHRAASIRREVLAPWG